MGELVKRITQIIAKGVVDDISSADIAAAVLSEMREPTPEMLGAAVQSALDKAEFAYPQPDRTIAVHNGPLAYWQAMIDEA